MRQLVSVYREASGAGPFGEPMDCTNDGVSARFARLLVITEDEPLPQDPMHDEGTPVCILTHGPVRGHPVIRPHPALLRGGAKAWTMFGGNFAASSDSRFIDAVAQISGTRSTRAVSIHDREE